MNFLCLQYTVQSMPLIPDLTNTTLVPSCWDSPGWIWLFQIPLLTIFQPHIYFSLYFSQIFSAQENETRLEEWGH